MRGWPKGESRDGAGERSVRAPLQIPSRGRVSYAGHLASQLDRPSGDPVHRRMEDSRSAPGNGLGLSLVYAVAKLHHADVRLEDNAPGLRVVLALPR